MTFSAPKSRPWRAYLKPEELARIQELDVELAELDRRRSLLSWERTHIQNRSTKRAAKAGAVVAREAAE